MPRTRNSKRSAADADPEDAVDAAIDTGAAAATNANDDSDDPAETALEAARRVRSRKAKQRRLEAQQRKPRFEILSEQGLMPAVVDMFDSPRDLFNLAFLSKSLQPFITREVVVRASVFHGGNSRKIIADIMGKIEKKSIYLPSAIRLLRLVNGRICENHEDCWGYDLKRQKLTNLAKGHYAFRPFGLLLCKECTKGLSTSFPYSNFAASCARVGGSYRTLDLPFFDSLGDRVGPVVVTKDLRRIEKSYKRYDQRTNVLKSMLEELDKADAAADEDEIIKALIGRHADAESRADAFISSKDKIFLLKSKAASMERASKKIARMKEIMTSLENSLVGYEHEEIALQHTWNENAGSIDFEHSPSRDVLSQLFASTSNASKKKIGAAAEELRRVYSMAAAKHLLPTGYLSSFSNDSHSLKRALFLHCEAKDITASTLLRTDFVNVKWIEKATDDMIVYLIIRNINVGELGREFALVTVDAESSENYRALAECSWDEVWSDYEVWRPKREEVCHAFSRATARYLELCDALPEYLASPSVLDFMHDTTRPLNSDHSVSRQAVVETIYKDRTGQDMLHDRCFAELIGRHTSMYEDPIFKETLLRLTG